MKQQHPQQQQQQQQQHPQQQQQQQHPQQQQQHPQQQQLPQQQHPQQQLPQQQQHQQVVKQQGHAGGLSPSLQELQKLQYHPQNRNQFHNQGAIPLRQQQVTSSTHPQPRPVIMYKPQGQAAAQGGPVGYRGASASPDQGYGNNLMACSYQQEARKQHQQAAAIHQQQIRNHQSLQYQQYQRSGKMSRSARPQPMGHNLPQVVQQHPVRQIGQQPSSISSATSLAGIQWHIPQTDPGVSGKAVYQQQQSLPQAGQQPVQQSPQQLTPTAASPSLLPTQSVLMGPSNAVAGQQGSGGGVGVAQGGSEHQQEQNREDELRFKIRLISPAVTSSVPKTPSPVTRAAKTPDVVLDALHDAALNAMLEFESLEAFGKAVDGQGSLTRDVTISLGPPLDNRCPDRSEASPSNKSAVGATSGVGEKDKAEPGGEVHSSTMTPPVKDSNSAPGENDDPNDDWCAVCMDGGDLVCCDNCPKVFHTGCHIPKIETGVPEDSWQCLLCQNIPPITEITKKRGRNHKGLTDNEQKILERIVLELYCQYDNSLHFRATVPPENMEYFKKVRSPMSFDEIKARLSAATTQQKYASVHQVIRDIRLVFRNAFNYYEVGTKEYHDGMQLEEFLEILLSTYLPQFAHTDLDQDSEDSDEEVTPMRKVRRIID